MSRQVKEICSDDIHTLVSNHCPTARRDHAAKCLSHSDEVVAISGHAASSPTQKPSSDPLSISVDDSNIACIYLFDINGKIPDSHSPIDTIVSSHMTRKRDRSLAETMSSDEECLAMMSPTEGCLVANGCIVNSGDSSLPSYSESIATVVDRQSKEVVLSSECDTKNRVDGELCNSKGAIADGEDDSRPIIPCRRHVSRHARDENTLRKYMEGIKKSQWQYHL